MLIVNPEKPIYQAGPRKRTQRATVTGGSVIALKYDGGVLVGCDTLQTQYGFAKHKGVSRITNINDNTLFCCSGDYADFAYVAKKFKSIRRKELNAEDGVEYSPKDYHRYLGKQQHLF